jgi:hypothetical protein
MPTNGFSGLSSAISSAIFLAWILRHRYAVSRVADGVVHSVNLPGVGHDVEGEVMRAPQT